MRAGSFAPTAEPRWGSAYLTMVYHARDADAIMSGEEISNNT